MDDTSHFVIPAKAVQWIASRAGGWGYLDLKFSVTEHLGVVSGYSDRENTRIPCVDPLLNHHVSRPFPETRSCGLWYRVRPDLHDLWLPIAARRCGIPISAFREFVIPDAWLAPKAGGSLVLAVSDDGGPRVSAWLLDGEALWPASSEAVDVSVDPLVLLDQQWPVHRLSGQHAVCIGAGSIGGAAADALAGAGVGRLSLVDPQRLELRNIARHVCAAQDVGRFKVKALADRIESRYPSTKVTPIVADVEKDADIMRPLFADADLVVVTSDGVLSRRVANHIARWAGKPCVFAAVLADGAIGEVIRSRPQDACLLCLRNDLVDRGAMDPEPALDAEYGTGTAHRPMTAAPTDLRLVGELAAKVALSTMLERAGYIAHRLPDGWMLIGLQPDETFEAPFDLRRAGETKWLSLPAKREDCISCARR